MLLNWQLWYPDVNTVWLFIFNAIKLFLDFANVVVIGARGLGIYAVRAGTFGLREE